MAEETHEIKSTLIIDSSFSVVILTVHYQNKTYQPLIFISRFAVGVDSYEVTVGSVSRRNQIS